MNAPQGRIFPRWLVALAALAAVGYGIYLLRGVLGPIFFAFLIAYMLDPVVDRLEKWRIPRAAGIVILLALVLGAIGLFVALVVPGIVKDVVDFARDIPIKAKEAMQRIEPWLERQGVDVPHSWNEAVETFGGDVRDVAGSAMKPAGKILTWLWGGTTNLLAAVGALLVVPVFAFYLLHDFDKMTSSVFSLVPPRYRPFVGDVAKEVDQVLGEFIRGQLIVMLILMVLFGIAYALLGVRLAVPIAIVAGLLSFIPYVGSAFALVAALLMCALDWRGWWQVVGVVAAYAVIQVLEGFVITPRVMEGKIGLSAIWVLIAVMVGGELFGFTGVLLAVPAAAVVKIFVVRGVAYYRKTPLFRTGAVDEPRGVDAILAEEGLPDSPETRARKEAVPHVEVAPTRPPPPIEAPPAVDATVEDAPPPPTVKTDPPPVLDVADTHEITREPAPASEPTPAPAPAPTPAPTPKEEEKKEP